MDDDNSILDDLEDELSEFTDSDPYDPAEEFEGDGDADEAHSVSVRWPDVEPVERDLTAEEWGIHGEGLERDWEAFAAMLNEGRIGSQPADVHPTRPEQATGWDETGMPLARDGMKWKGEHLFVRVALTPETMLRVQGEVGAAGDMTPERFATNLEPKVNDYVERFEDGDRPPEFFAFLDNDGTLQGPQEGRHRSAAAMKAGIDLVPAVLLWDTSGTFHRPSKYRDGTDGYRHDYPGRSE